MHFEGAFKVMQEQYEKMYTFMQNINVCVDVLRANNSIQTINNKKILKRIARIEDTLKIVHVDEPIPLTEKQLEEIQEDD